MIKTHEQAGYEFGPARPIIIHRLVHSAVLTTMESAQNKVVMKILCE